MKYWIFQSNQVLGPYEPDDLSKHSAFGAESLVCPEGRRGTSMGDWQRAGMVPDLSVALVRAAQAHGATTSVATLAGLPPEPTLKDLAVLGSLQEKMSMLEDVVLQLQEGLRVKDAELAALHSELAGKERQTSVMKTAMEREAAELKAETEERKREAEDLQSQTTEFKRKMTELEERVGVVNRLSETVEKAVEAEKNVEHDVEAQGATLAELTKEIENLRGQLNERLAAAAAAATPPAPVPLPVSTPLPSPEPLSPLAPDAAWERPSGSAEMPTIAPAPSVPAPVPAPEIAIELPEEHPAEPSALPSSSPLPAFGGAVMPSFGAAPTDAPISMPLDPMAATSIVPAQDGPVGGVEPVSAAAAAAAVLPAPAPAPAAAPGGKKKALLFGGLFGLLVLGAGVFFTGGLGKRKKPAMPAGMTDSAPLPTPTLPVPTPAPVAAAPSPAPVPPPALDPNDTAIETAKEWELPDGRRLGNALETLSPPTGNLSPWMAAPLTGGRVSVNYFAGGGTSGSPTVAYEFEVDLAAKAVTGRNPAAKAVLAGKAVPPPAPPKAKRVRIKPKHKANAVPKAKPEAKPKEENLDSLLGDGAPTAPKAEAKPQSASAPSVSPSSAKSDESVDDLLAPGDETAAKPSKPAKPTAAKRAAKAAAKSAPPAKSGKAADEALLDDILKE